MAWEKGGSAIYSVIGCGKFHRGRGKRRSGQPPQYPVSTLCISPDRTYRLAKLVQRAWMRVLAAAALRGMQRSQRGFASNCICSWCVAMRYIRQRISSLSLGQLTWASVSYSYLLYSIGAWRDHRPIIPLWLSGPLCLWIAKSCFSFSFLSSTFMHQVLLVPFGMHPERQKLIK